MTPTLPETTTACNARILIVEDERLIAEELRERLASLGATVVAAVVSGEQALEVNEALRPDLVLMDIRLKGEMDGIEAATRINRAHGTPVVFLTAHSDAATVERAKQARPYGYVLKPLQEHELRVTLSLALHRCHMERELQASQQASQHAEERLREAQKLEAVGRLAGGVAHDVNNMMTVVTGYADLLLSDLAPDDPNRGLVQEVKEAGDRTAGITRQLLSFSRHRIARPQVADVAALLTATEHLLRQVMPPGIVVRWLTAARRARIRIDPADFEQIMLNLAVNGRDAMPRGGTLTIATTVAALDAARSEDGDVQLPAGDYVLITVTDTGAGVAPEIGSRIFEPFFSTRTDGHGVGLGLSVVRDVVRGAGGLVRLHSQEGHGAAFTLYFPRVSELDDQSIPDLADDEDDDLRAEGRRVVLLAEDEEAVRGLTRTLLDQHGYTVIAARDGEEALELAAAYDGPIDMLVTDVVMPRLGGRELAQRIGALRPGTPALFMSGYTADTMLRRGIMQDGLAFLQKPFKGRHFLAAVRDVLRRPPAPA